MNQFMRIALALCAVIVLADRAKANGSGDALPSVEAIAQTWGVPEDKFCAAAHGDLQAFLSSDPNNLKNFLALFALGDNKANEDTLKQEKDESWLQQLAGFCAQIGPVIDKISARPQDCPQCRCGAIHKLQSVIAGCKQLRNFLKTSKNSDQ